MKSALILVIFSFFLIGVFGDSVSVMEGDSVTLHTDLTKIERADTLEWRLNGERIAKISMDSTGHISDSVSPDGAFRDRLQLDKQTGDLKITKFKTADSGEYLLKIKSTRGSSEKIFNVNGVLNSDIDPVKSVTVGESVTLKMQKQSDEVKWRFGPKKILIAELKVQANSSTVYDDVLDGKFRDRLKLDNQTGSLTITNITTEHDGDYEAGIRSRGSRYTIHKTFNVSVTEVNSVSVEEGGSVPLCTDLAQIQRNDVILWRFGAQGDIIARLNSPDVHMIWSNVNLNKQNGDLTISNIRRDQFGDYKVEINTINMISHRKYHISEIVTSVSVKEGHSVTLRTDASISRDDAVLWYGDKGVRITPSPGSVDPRWENTVQNDRTGDLTIRNIRRDQSGDYKVIFMNINGVSKHKKFHIKITDLSPVVPDSGLSPVVPDSGLSPAAPDSGLSPVVPDSGLSSAAIAGIVGFLLGFAAAATAGVIYVRHKRSKPVRSREVNGQNHTSDKDDVSTPLEEVKQQ